LSVSAAATFEERGSLNLTSYLDIVVVLVGAIVALALGAPEIGVVVGATAWIVVRVVSILIERRMDGVADLRRRLMYGVGFRLGRVWVLVCAIIAVGVTSTRENALTTAIVIFAAFSVYFACSAFTQVAQKGRPAS
jgi:uncharacterized membrane protein